jgi:hypothetical protein
VANIAGGGILWQGVEKNCAPVGKCLNNGGEYAEKYFEECRIDFNKVLY